MGSIDPDELAAALHRGVDDRADHFAIDLIIGCPSLLDRIAAEPTLFAVTFWADSDGPAARIGWATLSNRIDDLPLSTGELIILRAAGSFPSSYHQVNFGDVIWALDDANRRNVIVALAVAAGLPKPTGGVQ